MKTFFTGSRTYGKPTAKSDLDVFVWATSLERDLLIAAADKGSHRNGDEYDRNGLESVRFGMMNVIITTEARIFQAWERGTRELIAKRPVTRVEAIAHLDRVRDEFGVSGASP